MVETLMMRMLNRPRRLAPFQLFSQLDARTLVLGWRAVRELEIDQHFALVGIDVTESGDISW